MGKGVRVPEAGEGFLPGGWGERPVQWPQRDSTGWAGAALCLGEPRSAPCQGGCPALRQPGKSGRTGQMFVGLFQANVQALSGVTVP